MRCCGWGWLSAGCLSGSLGERLDGGMVGEGEADMGDGETAGGAGWAENVTPMTGSVG